jgi:hypothetical protein
MADKRKQKEINLDKVVDKVKTVLRDGPMCPECHNRTSRCRCEGA